MKCVLAAQLLLLSSVAFGGDKSATCELASKSIVSRSSSGIAQVGNLGDIQIRCYIAARPFPTKPGDVQYMPKVATVTYEVSIDGRKQAVPSEVQQSGGGHKPGQEWVDFFIHIPLDPAERDAEASRYLAKMQLAMPELMAPLLNTEAARQRAIQRIGDLVYQHRVGHFYVGCRVSDGDRLMGVGLVELEVLFEGRFSDLGLPGSPPV